MTLEFPRRRGANRVAELHEFAKALIETGPTFKMSSRGWGYWLEGEGQISKAEFPRVQKVINECRRKNILPLDFVLEDESRAFRFDGGGDHPDARRYAGICLGSSVYWSDNFDPDPWPGRGVYIQMLVEKIDLVELFAPICEVFRIPIATAGGWSDLHQRGLMIQRFQEMEARGNRPVLLYCGDHDPSGLRISDFLRGNIRDLREAKMSDMEEPWDPGNLVVDRFGLNHDFIESHDITWVENLITGSGKDLASPMHRDHSQPYVQEYLVQFGARKVEANAIMKRDTIDDARAMCISAIENHLGTGTYHEFRIFTETKRAELEEVFKDIGLYQHVSELQVELEKLKHDGGDVKP